MPETPKRTTVKQLAVLTFMKDFHKENDSLPSYNVIRLQFGWKSPNNVFCYMNALVDRGHLERNSLGGYRFTGVADRTKEGGVSAIANSVFEWYKQPRAGRPSRRMRLQ